MEYIPYNIVTQFKDFFPHKKSTQPVTLEEELSMKIHAAIPLYDKMGHIYGVAVQDPSKCLTFIP